MSKEQNIVRLGLVRSGYVRVRGRRPRRVGGVMIRVREGVQGRKPSRVGKRDKP